MILNMELALHFHFKYFYAEIWISLAISVIEILAKFPYFMIFFGYLLSIDGYNVKASNHSWIY